ncbi:MAG: hypothetical protein JSV64_04875 [Candidatus Bathyarchaeota archaeon]|jgi:hypothetical protein|nr:MAG: hypothetical protein JSV64_04875 [Candidatus Bathyarchaeota archaeon]
MAKQEQTNNPHNVCTWKPVSECKNCTIVGRLKCRCGSGDLLHFIGLFLSFLFPALIGIVLSGYSWSLLGWAGLAVIFFGFWEIRILCSHCPFYAEKGRVLHCIANYGCPKFWKYHPEPINNSEKIQLVIGFILICGYPFPFLILGRQFILSLLTAWGLILFFWTSQKYTCSKCVNFSCLLNRVPREVVDEYLKHNPAIRKAWEENGWQIGVVTS